MKVVCVHEWKRSVSTDINNWTEYVVGSLRSLQGRLMANTIYGSLPQGNGVLMFETPLHSLRRIRGLLVQCNPLLR